MRSREFTELRALASIAEHGNFARAAAQLGVSRSALSQIIRGLEERLGVRLLNRTTRSVAPSDAGARLLARIAPALAELDAAQNDLVDLRDEPVGPLRITLPRFVALQLIGPRLGAFYEAHPGIQLELVMQESLTDIVVERFDAGIRLGERLAQDMIAVPLSAEMQMFVVGAPSYLAAHGTPHHPRELAEHRCINMRMASDMRMYRWEFEHTSRAFEVAVAGPLTVNLDEIALTAARQGVGLAYVFEQQAAPYLHSGELVRVLAAWTPPFPGFYLYHPSRHKTPPALRAFIEFFRHNIRARTRSPRKDARARE